MNKHPTFIEFIKSMFKPKLVFHMFSLGIVLAGSTIILWELVLILFNGAVMVYEPNMTTLITEIGLASYALIYIGASAILKVKQESLPS